MHDANAAVVTILGPRGHDTHRLPLPLDGFADLQLVVEPNRGLFSREAVRVKNVVERI